MFIKAITKICNPQAAACLLLATWWIAGCVPQQPGGPESAAIFRGDGVMVARPPEAWQRHRTQSRTLVVAWKERDSNSRIRISKTESGGIGIEEWTKFILNLMRAIMETKYNESTLTLLEEGEVKIGNYKFRHQLVGSEVIGPDGTQSGKQEYYSLEEGGFFYSLALVASNSKYNKDRLTFQAVLKSFRVE